MNVHSINIITWGGLGDIMLSTPSYRVLKERYPKARITVYCRTVSHKDILENNPYIDKLRLVGRMFYLRSFLLSLLGKKPELLTFNYAYLVPSMYYQKHATEIIGEMLGVDRVGQSLELYISKQEDKKAKEYLSKFSIPVIIHITSKTSSNQHWPLANWEKLISHFPEISFIQIGMAYEDKVKGAVDLRGKTSITEALAVLKHSVSFVGVVSGFAHATSAFRIPGVILFGPSTPIIWGHNNNINLFKRHSCAPCIDTLLRYECPYSVKCLSEISVDEVKRALTQQLGLKNEVKFSHY